MRTESLQFLRDVVNTPSPSGYEQQAARVFREYTGTFAATETDVMGNTYATINADAPVRVMLTGHIDELGFIVKHIGDDGLLYVAPVGGHDSIIPFGQRVWVHGFGARVNGVMGRRAIHLMSPDERTKRPELHELWVDIGARDGDQAKEIIRLGDPITYQYEMAELLDDRVAARGFDDKMGAWVVAETLRVLADDMAGLHCSVTAVATVQEEIGLRGAHTAAYRCNPLVGIAVDVCHSIDYPGGDKKRHGDTVLGKGPVVCRGANINPVVFNMLVKAAQEADIPLQLEVAAGGTGTDANAIQLSRAGVAAGLVAVPLRYMHTPGEVLSLADMDNTVALLAAFIRLITPETSFIPMA